MSAEKWLTIFSETSRRAPSKDICHVCFDMGSSILGFFRTHRLRSSQSIRTPLPPTACRFDLKQGMETRHVSEGCLEFGVFRLIVPHSRVGFPSSRQAASRFRFFSADSEFPRVSKKL